MQVNGSAVIIALAGKSESLHDMFAHGPHVTITVALCSLSKHHAPQTDGSLHARDSLSENAGGRLERGAGIKEVIGSSV